MSDLNPQAPSQPSQQTGFNQDFNPASKTTEEEHASNKTTSSETIDRRTQHDVPSQHQGEPQGSALGSGDTGPLKQRNLPESDAQNYGEDPNLDGEQMRAPGEGEVSRAVESGGGGGHKEEASLTRDLDRKRMEHDEELHKRGERTGKEIEEEENEDWTGRKADIGEALSGRGNKIVLAPEE